MCVAQAPMQQLMVLNPHQLLLPPVGPLLPIKAHIRYFKDIPYYICMYIYMYTNIYIYIYMYIYMYIYIKVYMCICLKLYLYQYLKVCIYIYLYVNNISLTAYYCLNKFYSVHMFIRIIF